MMVKLLLYHTGMCIKGPESWWIAKSITPQLVVNQSKTLDWFTTPEIVIDFAIHQLSSPLISTIQDFQVLWFLQSKTFKSWDYLTAKKILCFQLKMAKILK